MHALLSRTGQKNVQHNLDPKNKYLMDKWEKKGIDIFSNSIESQSLDA